MVHSVNRIHNIFPNQTAIKTNGYIGFEVTSNAACEGDIAILEFSLDGVEVATAEPTKMPTKAPSQTPTTAAPTMAPTAQCKGQITWGDPHYQLMAHSTSNAPAQLNFQGHGWFYYLMPCDLNEYEEWPFFLLSHHRECWWRGNLKGCIDNNRLVLNTKPDPWIIDFSNSNLDVECRLYLNSFWLCLHVVSLTETFHELNQRQILKS